MARKSHVGLRDANMKHFLVLLALAAIGYVVAQDGLTIEVIRSSECSLKTKSGDLISVNYNGTLTDGTLFDSSTS
ncbi:MAG: hypothetical protein CL912_20815 [Deltaproteobacteria bacterium]|nr:hypothetical protein [Deltaproteobacteria bacterium]